MLRVTFDTNVLDKACRPERHPKDPKQPLMQRIHDALAAREIAGFYSVTILTIEGIMKKDRAKVFAGTRLVPQPARTKTTTNADLPDAIHHSVESANVLTISQELRVEQPDRAPLHPEVIARIRAAKALGLKALRDVPRIGAYDITDKSGDFYLDIGEGAALRAWIDKAHEVVEAMESRGVGIAPITALGTAMAKSNPDLTWFEALDQATDCHERRAVERAFSEWSDGDSLAAHIAYGLDYFCTNDMGKTGATSSVLDAQQRAWLTTTYGVRFITFEGLAAML